MLRVTVLSKWTFLGLGLLALAAVSFACGDDGPSEAEAVTELCSDLTGLRAADAAFDELGSDSTINEIAATNQAYNDALDDVVDSAQDVASIRSEPVEDAYADLDQGIDDISGDATIAEALTSIEDELVALGNAYDQAFASLDCS